MTLETSGVRRSRPGLDPSRLVLDNGVVLIAKHTRTMPAVSIDVAVRAGSLCDTAEAAGATWLLSRVADRGTASRSAAEIAEALDRRGISLTVGVTRHLVSLTCTCLSDDFEAVVELLADILMHPSFPDEEIATRKGEIVTAIRQDEDNTAVRATETLMALLYPGGHPYGRRTKGSIDTVERLTRDHLVALHRERFRPAEIAAAIVGDVAVERAGEAVARALGGWRQPRPEPIPLPPAVPATERRRVVISMMNKAQADIAYGFVTIRRTDPAYHAVLLMNNVFGQYALGGRLGERIREREGMAYYVGSSVDPSVAEGPLVVRAGVGSTNVDRAVQSIDEEVDRLAREGITQGELDDSRRYLIGAMPRALETNAAIAAFLQTAEFFDLGLDYDLRMPDFLRAVTLDEVNAAARRAVDSTRATIVVAGPYREPDKRVIG